MLLIVGGKLEDALQNIWDALWHSGINVFTHTAPELTYAFPAVADLMMGMRVLVAAVRGFAVVLTACSLAGREGFGWGSDLGEHLGRIGLAAILANRAPLGVQYAINLNNQLCDAIGAATLRPIPGDRGYDDLAIILMLIGLLWFGLKLGLKMLYRIGMLWILIPTAPVALCCWALPQAEWVAKTWTRQFVGWTFGQVLVTIALKLAFENNPYGQNGAVLVGGVVQHRHDGHDVRRRGPTAPDVAGQLSFGRPRDLIPGPATGAGLPLSPHSAPRPRPGRLCASCLASALWLYPSRGRELRP